jgi:chromosome segregation ATPase
VPTKDEEPVRRHEMDRVAESLSDMRRAVERHERMLKRAGADYDANVDEIRELRERLEWYETPDSSSQRLQRLEQGLARLEGQLDLLLRLQQGSVALPPRAPAPGAPPAPGPGTA